MEQQLIAGLDGETLDFTLESLSEFARRELPDSLLIELDERDEFERAWCSNGDIVGRLAPGLPPAHGPPGQPTEIAPRLIELCFQTAGVGELGKLGRMGLPTHVDRVVRFKGTDERGPLFAVVHPRDGEGVDAEVVDESGKVRVRLEDYMTTALPGGLDPEALDPIRAAMG